MSVAVELGFKRYCQKCHLPFYDKFADPVVCPHCAFSTSVAKFTHLKSSRVAMSVAEEDVGDETIEENIEDIEINSEIDIGDIGVMHKDDHDDDEVIAINEDGAEEEE